MAVIMKGIDVVNSMKEKMLKEVEQLKSEGINPCLAIVRLGARPDDLAYERGAVKRCEGLGIKSTIMEYPENIGQDELISEIQKINADENVHGILLFRPLPKHINENVIKYVISPDKDIDCLNPVNVAKMFEGDESGFAPCTFSYFFFPRVRFPTMLPRAVPRAPTNADAPPPPGVGFAEARKLVNSLQVLSVNIKQIPPVTHN